MAESVTVALLALFGTLAGSFGGILTANKLTNYRIKQLEKRVEEHNTVIRRTFILEEQMRSANHRIDELEHKNIGT